MVDAQDSGSAPSSPADVIAFWRDAGPSRWFAKDEVFDDAIRSRFAALQARAAKGGLSSWQESDEGMLALILLLDQFPRNLFRGSPQAFASDAQALALAELAIMRGVDRRIDPALRRFIYLPFMHSERIADQRRCIALFEAINDIDSLHHAHVHADIIERFGRFPHRNAVLGRATTPAEAAFLAAGGFAG